MGVTHKPKAGALLTGTEYEATDAHLENVSTIADAGASQSLSVATPVHDLTLTEACTLTLTGATDGQADSIVILLRQDGTGSRTVTWPAEVEWPDGITPTLATDAAAVDVFALVTVDGGTEWLGFHANKKAGVTASMNQLAADVSISSTNTFFDGPSLSLAAGTYVLFGSVHVATGGGGRFTAKLWDGTTSLAEGLSRISAGFEDQIALNGYVVVASTATWKVSVAGGATGTIRATAAANSSGNIASTLTALRLS